MSPDGPAGRAARGVLVVAFIVLVMLVPVGRARADEDLAFTVLEHGLPTRLCQDEGLTVDVVLRNDGAQTWSAAAGDHLAYHWLDATGAVVEREGRRTAITATVLPGRTHTVRARVWGPERPGRYILEWAMVREKVRWYAEPEAGDARGRAAVDVAEGAPPLAFSVVVHDVPPMVAGERAPIAVTLRNDGCAAWSPLHGDALAYHWFDLDAREVVHEGVRTPLPVVSPGASVELAADVEAAAAAGTHVLVFEPVREHIAWFGEPTTGTASATIEVSPPTLAWSLLGADMPARGHAGEVIAVRMRVRNEGTEAWATTAGDRLSYRFADDPDAPARDGVRTAWPSGAVDPGEEVTLDATLELPMIPGRYTVGWRPVREHVRWLGPSSAASGDFIIDVGPPQLAWSVVVVDVSPRLWSSRTTFAQVRVRNEGGDTWSAKSGDRMSYRWYGDDGVAIAGEGMRSELPSDVAPGEEVTIDVHVRAPDGLGPAVLELGMVREHVAWFPPPPRAERARVRVIVVRWGLLVTAAGLCALAVLGIAARLAPPGRRSAAIAHAWAPAHAMVACLGIGEIFSDLAHIEAWTGVAVTSASASAWMALPLMAIPLRARTAAAAALIAAAFAVALVDLGYLDFFGSIVPSSALTAIHHLGDAHATVFSLWHPEYLQLAWPLASLVTLFGLAPPRSGGTAPTLVVAAALVVLATPAASAVAELAASPVGARVFSERDNVGRLGLWNAHLFEVGRQLGRWIGVDALAPEERREVDAWFAARAQPRAPTQRAPTQIGPGTRTPPNVVVIQIEALQSWMVDAEVDGTRVMPFLHGADAEALHFTHVFDQTAQGRTSDAEYLVMQSGHPLRTGALAFLRADNEFDTVAHRLAEADYATLSAHPYVRGFWNRAAIHPRYGFGRSMFRDEIGSGPMVGWGLSDVEFLARMVAVLPTLREPFFGFFITLSLHHPYTEFPAHLAELELGELDGTALGNYLQGMRHADRALEGFFAGLRAAGLDARTVVLVYGDHVAGLPRTAELEAFAGAERWDPTVPVRAHRVPALLWLPGAARTGRDPRVAGQIDLGPTVLDAAGVAAPPSFVGRSLLQPAIGGVAVLPDGTAIAEDRMWIARGRDGISGGGCFDRDGRSRTRSDCDDLARRAADELWASRALLDHDLYRAMLQ